ncbi:tyrosine-type recombinase/integrase [Pseudomonas taeanensis]|uniref:tyrosine-type recombinase/integrase n=1 Tax=Pseudomonas taeanensis TaxID=574962 RepID=UPI0004B772F7|nr:tyrosine-type recombinase/integrase [Pseudomonas taeanensis]
MSHYLLRTSVQIPLRAHYQTLIDSRTGLQPVLISLWAEHLSAGTKPNTAIAYLRDLTYFLEWAEEMNISLKSRFRKLIGLHSHEIVSLTQKFKTRSDGEPVKAGTYNRKIISTLDFINFHMQRYLDLNCRNNIDYIANNKRIEKITKQFSRLMKNEVEVSLDQIPHPTIPEPELNKLLEIVHPDSSSNPYKYDPLKLRNYCIIITSIECLLRRSELVLLELDDFEDSEKPTIRIKKPHEKNLKSNKDHASLKTNGRVLPISRELAHWLQIYIEDSRPKLLKKAKPNRSLFISSKTGKRLSANSANNILKPLELKYLQIFRKKEPLNFHMLRVTGSNLLKSSAENNLGDMPGLSKYLEINEIITYSGGWSSTSKMPRHYTRDSIAAKARHTKRLNNHE